MSPSALDRPHEPGLLGGTDVANRRDAGTSRTLNRAPCLKVRDAACSDPRALPRSDERRLTAIHASTSTDAVHHQLATPRSSR
jgi:hypothetical protein